MTRFPNRNRTNHQALLAALRALGHDRGVHDALGGAAAPPASAAPDPHALLAAWSSGYQSGYEEAARTDYIG